MQLMLRESPLTVVGIDFGHSHVQVAVADIAQETNHDRKLGETVSEISEPGQSVR